MNEYDKLIRSRSVSITIQEACLIHRLISQTCSEFKKSDHYWIKRLAAKLHRKIMKAQNV